MQDAMADQNISVLPTPVWLTCGDGGLMLDFQGFRAMLTGTLRHIESDLASQMARSFAQLAEDKRASGALPGLTDIVPALSTVLFRYDPTCQSQAAIKTQLSLLLDQIETTRSGTGRCWQMPCLYGGKGGPDLAEVAARTKLSETEVIQRHQESDLMVATMGFLPGNGYLTGLDPSLYLPRRSAPRTHITAGTVAIAMDQSVIYPMDSPGGWNLLGRTPIRLFDQARTEAVLFRAGDKVQFMAISQADFEAIEKRVAAGELGLEMLEAKND